MKRKHFFSSFDTQEPDRHCRRKKVIQRLLALIGGAVILYFFVTEILLRVLAYFTRSGGGAL